MMKNIRLEKEMAELDKIRERMPYRETRLVDFPEWRRHYGWADKWPKVLVRNFEHFLRDNMNIAFDWESATFMLNDISEASYAFLHKMSFVDIDSKALQDLSICSWGYFGVVNDLNLKEEIEFNWDFYLRYTLASFDIPREDEPDEYERYLMEHNPA